MISLMETCGGWVVTITVQGEKTLLYHEKQMMYETYKEARAFIDGALFIKDCKSK